jgi:hypothetical protein
VSEAEFTRKKELWRRFRTVYHELKAIALEIQGKQGRVRRGGRQKKIMPIYEGDGSLILHFGRGDVAVVTGRNTEKDYEDELCFVRQSEHEIGAPVDPELAGKATDVVDCPVRLVFDNVESLDVVIEELQKLRAKMEARI